MLQGRGRTFSADFVGEPMEVATGTARSRAPSKTYGEPWNAIHGKIRDIIIDITCIAVLSAAHTADEAAKGKHTIGVTGNTDWTKTTLMLILWDDGTSMNERNMDKFRDKFVGTKGQMNSGCANTLLTKGCSIVTCEDEGIAPNLEKIAEIVGPGTEITNRAMETVETGTNCARLAVRPNDDALAVRMNTDLNGIRPSAARRLANQVTRERNHWESVKLMPLVAVTGRQFITRIISGQTTVTVEGRNCLPHGALQIMKNYGTRRTHVTVYTDASHQGMSERVDNARLASWNELTRSHGTGDERMQDAKGPEVKAQGGVLCSGALHFTPNLMHWPSSPATGRRRLWTPRGRLPLGAA